MHQTIFARQQINECTKVDDPLDLAVIDTTDFDLGGNLQHPVYGCIGRFLIRRVDAHATIIIDVDRGTGFFGNERMVAPPLPITSRILSGSIFRAIIFGAFSDSSVRDAEITLFISPRIWRRAPWAFSRATSMISSVIP